MRGARRRRLPQGVALVALLAQLPPARPQLVAQRGEVVGEQARDLLRVGARARVWVRVRVTVAVTVRVGVRIRVRVGIRVRVRVRVSVRVSVTVRVRG